MPTSAEASASRVEKGTASLMTRTFRLAALSATALAMVMADQSALAQGGPVPVPVAAKPAPNPLSEGVVAVVNDQIISTYDLRQRMRLLIVTSGEQPTPEALQQIQQEALRSLIDEHLEVQEIQREEKEQKFKIMADDKDVHLEGTAARQAQLGSVDRRPIWRQPAEGRPRSGQRCDP